MLLLICHLEAFSHLDLFRGDIISIEKSI